MYRSHVKHACTGPCGTFISVTWTLDFNRYNGFNTLPDSDSLSYAEIGSRDPSRVCVVQFNHSGLESEPESISESGNVF